MRPGARFDDVQASRLWKAFGLADFFDGVPPFRVLGGAGADEEPPPPETSTPETEERSGSPVKPWWKLW